MEILALCDVNHAECKSVCKILHRPAVLFVRNNRTRSESIDVS